MADDRHPIQKLLDDRAEAARIAKMERAKGEARVSEAWVAVSILIAEAVTRANAVLKEIGTVVNFKFQPLGTEGGPRLEIYDDVDLGPPTFHLSLDLDALPEPRVLARGYNSTFAAPFSNLDMLLTDIYADFTEPLSD